MLTDCYSLPTHKLCDVLGTLLLTKEIVVAHADTAWLALRQFKSGKAYFADCLIERFANKVGCDCTAKFDRDAVKRRAMRLVG